MNKTKLRVSVRDTINKNTPANLTKKKDEAVQKKVVITRNEGKTRTTVLTATDHDVKNRNCRQKTMIQQRQRGSNEYLYPGAGEHR